MKYIFQMGVIFAVSFAGEVLHALLPLPVPASVYGLALLFLLLLSGVVKLKHVEDAAEYLMAVMPVFFIEPSVGLMESFGVVRGSLVSLVLACALSTLAVLCVTGLTAQAVIRHKKRRLSRQRETREKGGAQK